MTTIECPIRRIQLRALYWLYMCLPLALSGWHLDRLGIETLRDLQRLLGQP